MVKEIFSNIFQERETETKAKQECWKKKKTMEERETDVRKKN